MPTDDTRLPSVDLVREYRAAGMTDVQIIRVLGLDVGPADVPSPLPEVALARVPIGILAFGYQPKRDNSGSET